jgi:hypothetical protein
MRIGRPNGPLSFMLISSLLFSIGERNKRRKSILLLFFKRGNIDPKTKSIGLNECGDRDQMVLYLSC